MMPDLKAALQGSDAVIFAVRHKPYLNLDPEEVVQNPHSYTGQYLKPVLERSSQKEKIAS